MRAERGETERQRQRETESPRNRKHREVGPTAGVAGDPFIRSTHLVSLAAADDANAVRSY